MGAACCVAVKSNPVFDGPNGPTSWMNSRRFQSWNVRWDNRGPVAGEETAVRWFTDMRSGDSQLGNISETEVGTISKGESPENTQPFARSRSLFPEEGIQVPDIRSPNSDTSVSWSISLEGKESTNFRAPDRSPMMPSISSVSTSPLHNGDLFFHASSTPARLTHQIPGTHLNTQATDGRIAGLKSLGTNGDEPSPMHPGWINHSARGSHDGSSDSCSMPEYMAYSRRGRCSFDSNSLGLNDRDTISRSSSRHSSSPFSHIKTCGACTKLLSDKSSFSSQKLVSTNELAVFAVLVCGHVYHAECLERMTPEVSKYDPACPVCTFGEQQAMKLSEKEMKAEMESRLKYSKRSRSRIVDSEYESHFVHDMGKGVKVDSSSGMKSSFLKRHFSFGSKANKPLLENQFSKKKSLSWSRSRK